MNFLLCIHEITRPNFGFIRGNSTGRFGSCDEFTTSLCICFVERQRIGDFQKLTGEFVDKVTTAIGDPGLSQGPQPHLAEFRKLTAQFQRDVINAVLINPPEPDRIFGLLNSYDDGVERIFLGGPDTIPELLQDYGRNVFQIFGLGPR